MDTPATVLLVGARPGTAGRLRSLGLAVVEDAGAEADLVLVDDAAAPFEARGRPVLRAPVDPETVRVTADALRRARVAEARCRLTAGQAAAAREALREREGRLQALADNVPDVVLYQAVVDEGGVRFTFLSANVERVFGVGADEALADPGALRERMLPEDRAAMEAAEAEAIRARSVFRAEVRMRRRDGSLRRIALASAPRTLPDGREVWEGAVVDVTDQWSAREDFERNALILQAICDTTPDAIYVKDREGRMVLANPAAAAALGFAPDQVVGRGHDEYLRGEMGDRLRENDEAVMRTGEARVFEETLPGGRIFLSTKSPMRDASGAVVGLIGISRDITDRKRAEAALRQADRRKDEFLAMLAHELRNPLAPIASAVEVLRLAGEDAGTREHARAVVERQVGHMARLVDDLLDVSRITRGRVSLRRERCDLATLTRQVVDDYRAGLEAAGLTLSADLAAGPLPVDGDPTRLTQAFGNLLHNAGKYTEAGGRVHVTLERAGAEAVLSVRDTGVGLEPALLEHVFEPFVQADRSLDRRRGGLGLGLALVRGLVELHGGRVSAESAGRGRGATFRVRLPLAPEAGEAPRAPSGEGARRRRVLIVEDNEDAAQTMEMLLRLQGHEVRVAGDGAAGLALAREFAPEVVLCDLGLPGDLDGFGVARALRAEPATAGLRLIALTGYGAPEDRARTRDAGFDVHLTKPVDLAALTRALG